MPREAFVPFDTKPPDMAVGKFDPETNEISVSYEPRCSALHTLTHEIGHAVWEKNTPPRIGPIVSSGLASQEIKGEIPGDKEAATYLEGYYLNYLNLLNLNHGDSLRDPMIDIDVRNGVTGLLPFYMFDVWPEDHFHGRKIFISLLLQKTNSGMDPLEAALEAYYELARSPFPYSLELDLNPYKLPIVTNTLFR